MSPGRLFVTGGTGYIGGVVIEHAIANGYKVSKPMIIVQIYKTSQPLYQEDEAQNHSA
jgi:UDP-glucose 4-epimerase